MDSWAGKIPLEKKMAPHAPEYSFLGNPMDRGAWGASHLSSRKIVRRDLTMKQQQAYVEILSG